MRVVPHYSEDQGPASQRRHVRHRVGAAAGNQRLALVGQDEDGRLPTDPPGNARNENVRQQIRQDDDRLTRHGVRPG